MTDLTAVILTEGKVLELEVPLGIDHLTYRFGKFPISHAERVTLRAENRGERKLLVSGSAKIEVQIPCARCLEPVASELDIRFENELGADDKDYIEGNSLNVDRLVHDEALLIWPERTLCREDCKGLCSTCGQNLNHGSCTCGPTDLDPRMAKILDIFNNAGR